MLQRQARRTTASLTPFAQGKVVLDGRDIDGRQGARSPGAGRGRRGAGGLRPGGARHGARRRGSRVGDLHPDEAQGCRRGRDHLVRPPSSGRHGRGRPARPRRGAERRRRGGRNPRAAAAPGPHRRGACPAHGRSDQGRGRLPPVQRGSALPRPADPRARDADRRDRAPRRVRDPARRRQGGRRRPELDRRQARGDAAARAERDRHDLPFAHGRSRRGDAGGGRARRRRRPGRRDHGRTWSSPARP